MAGDITTGHTACRHPSNHSMGQTVSRLFDSLFARDTRVLMLGLDGAGKTTLLYKLKLDELVTTIPTIGFNCEEVTYRNLHMMIWDIGGQDRIRALCARRVGARAHADAGRRARARGSALRVVTNVDLPDRAPRPRAPAARHQGGITSTRQTAWCVEARGPAGARVPRGLFDIHSFRPCHTHTRHRCAQIFVVDCNDRDRLHEARDELHRVLNDEAMDNPLVLVYANKCAPRAPHARAPRGGARATLTWGANPCQRARRYRRRRRRAGATCPTCSRRTRWRTA